MGDYLPLAIRCDCPDQRATLGGENSMTMYIAVMLLLARKFGDKMIGLREK